jgi:hypothetical protein
MFPKYSRVQTKYLRGESSLKIDFRKRAWKNVCRFYLVLLSIVYEIWYIFKSRRNKVLNKKWRHALSHISLTNTSKVIWRLCLVLFLFVVHLGSLPLVFVAGSYGGCVHWTPPFLVDLVYHIFGTDHSCKVWMKLHQ